MKTKIIITIILFIFSYYYTNKCINFLKQNDKLMQEIINKQDYYNKDYINAIITNNIIIPGISGKRININKTYNKMKKINKFDESLIIYDYIKPVISITDNYNKVIVSGNSHINKISIILSINDNYLFYLLNNILVNNNVKANILTNSLFNINNTNFINILSSNYSNNIDYCISNTIMINKECFINNKYTILGKYINNYHLTNTKNIINNGSILIYTFNRSNYNDLNIIIKYLKNNNYNIVSINELIKE